MFGSNHFYVVHHPHDPDLKKKEKEAKKEGKPIKEETPTFEQAQEEIAKNSGFYGNLADKKNGSKGEPSLSEIVYVLLLAVFYRQYHMNPWG